MAQVIPLFVKDELTGRMIPNRKPSTDPSWVVINTKTGRACNIKDTRNEAINAMYMKDNPSDYHIEKF